MATVKVLIEGYAMPLEKGWKASSTTCLIVTADKKIITDPGCNRQKLLAALDQESLVKDDIEIIDTPGHVSEHLSLLVDTSEGKVAIAGDVIWWSDMQEQIVDPYQKELNQAVDIIIKAFSP